MSGVQTSLALQDRLTGPLMKMMRSMDATIRVMERMDASASNIDTRGLENARRSLQNATADMARLSSAASTAGTNGLQPLQNQFTNLPGPVGQATSSVRNFFAGFVGAAAAYLSLQSLANGFKSFIKLSDQTVTTTARLDLMNDGLQTTKQLQEMIFQSAQRTGSAYQHTADMVGKLGMQAADAFSSNQELVSFAEQINKTFSIAGTSVEGVSSVMLQLTQAMAAGKLQGEELNAILDNAQPIVANIAKYMDVPVGSIKKLASEGQISAEIIKNAMFAAANETNKLFDSMPLTFGQAMSRMGNRTKSAFEPLFIRFNEFVNSDTFSVLAEQVLWFVNVFVAGMSIMFDVIGFIYSAIGAVAEYWPIIAAGLGVLLAVYFPAIMSYLSVMAIKLWIMLEPILAQAAAWLIAYWPILLIIGVVVALIAILMHFGVTTEQIIGFIGGLFYSLGAIIWNVIANAWNTFAMFAEFLINLFIDPTYAMKKLIFDMATFIIDNMSAMAGSFDTAASILGKVFVAAANIAIGGINMLIKALNMIPGVDIGEVGKVSVETSGLISNGLKAMANNLEAPTSTKNVVSLGRMDLKSVPGAYKSGYSAGSNLKMPSLGGKGMGGEGVAPSMSAVPANMLDAKSKNPTGGKLDSIGKIDDEINIAEEDLKLLKELADVRSIQNFRTLQPSFSFGDVTVREEADMDKLISKINESMENQMKASVEGAYA